jgi:hypothetical protein
VGGKCLIMSERNCDDHGYTCRLLPRLAGLVPPVRMTGLQSPLF